MIKLKFTKSFCVAGALSALAMSINTALGDYDTDKVWVRFFAKCHEISRRLKNLDPGAIRTAIQQIYPDLSDLTEDESEAILFGLCLGINPKSLEDRSSKCRILLSKLKNDELFCAFIHESSDEMWRSPDETYQLGSEDGSVVPVLEMLLKHTDLVSQLDLNGSFIGASGASSISEALKVNSSLTQLDLEGNNIVDSGASSIADALKVNSSLTDLNLSSNPIGKSGIRSLAEALKVNSSLTQLDLHNNEIGAFGANSLSEVLKVNSSLTTLDLNDNWISDSGASSIAEALKENSSLTQLSLRGGNDISDSGASSIAEALKVNSSLTQLSLRGNNIGDSGASSLADGLKVNSSLTTLDLGYTLIGHSGRKALADALESRQIQLSIATPWKSFRQREKCCAGDTKHKHFLLIF